MQQEKRILILGVGNTLLGDEGFGVHAMRYLLEHCEWPDNVRLVDGGTLGLLLLAELLECDLAIILDIAKGGHTPGTFYKIAGEELVGGPAMKASMHQTSLEDVLISCELAGHRPETIIYAMEPYDYQDLAAYLTSEAAARLPEFCQKVLQDLATMDIAPVAQDIASHPSR